VADGTAEEHEMMVNASRRRVSRAVRIMRVVDAEE
jgi:hypothetical protein